MTEINQVRKVARDYLAPFGRMERVEDKIKLGVPDIYYVLRGVSGWIEAKIIPLNGECPDHFTLEQLMWGEEEVRCGGRWHLLGRCGSAWRLYDTIRARQWRDGSKDNWLFSITERFPTREILDQLAPLPPYSSRTSIVRERGNYEQRRFK